MFFDFRRIMEIKTRHKIILNIKSVFKFSFSLNIFLLVEILQKYLEIKT